MNKRQKIVQEQFLNNEEAVIKRLKSVYGQSLKDITGKLSSLDSSISALQKAVEDVTEDEIGNLAAAFLNSKKHYTPEEAKETLQSMLQSKVYQKNYQKALKKQVGDVLDKMHDKEFKTVEDYLKTCYEDGFIGTMFDLQGQGIPLCFPMDQEAMVRAVQLDSKISQGLYSRLGEDVSLLKKKITAQVSRGISTGMSFQQVAKQLANYTNIGFNNAVRIARTEGHRIQVQSGMDACYKAKEKGADVVKQWDSTLDGRTRETHAAVDGEIRELDEKFSNGLMFPGDPAGGAAEVINCRCALLQRARWALDEAELETLKKRAGYFGLDKADTFEEYKNKYLEVAKDQQTSAEKDRIRQRMEAYKQRVKPNTEIKHDFDSMDKKTLEKWASEHLKTKFVDVKGTNEALLRETVKVFAEFESKMGGKTIPGLRVQFGGTASNQNAAFVGKTNTLLLKKTGNLLAINERMEATDARALRKLHRRQYAVSSYSGSVWHELGHAVDWDTGEDISRALSATADLSSKSVKISNYAGSSPAIGAPRRSEAWAENFSAYMNGGTTAKEVPSEIVHMIEDYFKNKRG